MTAARRRRVVRPVRLHAVAGGDGSRGGPIRAARRASRRSHRQPSRAACGLHARSWLFASILALTGFIGRRAGEATVLLAAAAFMIQRLATHWRIRRARALGRTAIGEPCGRRRAVGQRRRGRGDARGRRPVAKTRLRRLRGCRGRRRPDLFLAAPRRSDRPAGAHARRWRSRAADRAGEARDQRDAEPIERFFDQPTRSLVSGVLPVSPW